MIVIQALSARSPDWTDPKTSPGAVIEPADSQWGALCRSMPAMASRAGLRKARIDLRDVGTIFVTHHHDDHTAGLGTLMSAAWDQNRTNPINVYGPPPTEAFVKAVVQLFSISAEIRIADGSLSVPIAQVFFGHDAGTGVVYQDANIKVTAVENTHYAFHRGTDVGRHKSYAYRFEAPDRVIVFTGDTGPSDAVTELAKSADLLVTPTSSFKDRMRLMIETGRWQAMTLLSRHVSWRRPRGT
jgi:ribonuclease BN (tRNA processing enzyme)